jgi:hypothetical protein
MNALKDNFHIERDSPRPRAKANFTFKLTPYELIKWSASPEYLVKGLIPLSGLVLVYGAPKCGKSFWALYLAMHIAVGWSYRDRRVRQGAVVYIAAEGQKGFEKRVEAFRQRHDAHGAQFFLITARPDLIADHAPLIKEIGSQLGGVHPTAIFIDTVNRTLVGSESKDADMARYLRAAGVIEDSFSCAVILIHHCGIEKGRPRGHTSLIAAADVQIAISRDKAENVVATVELAKDGPSGDQIVSRLEVVPIGQDEDGDVVTSCIVIPVDAPLIKSAEKRLSKRVQLAVRVLADVVCERGQNDSRAPADCKTVKLEEWRDECYRRSLFDDESLPESIDKRANAKRRKAFSRAKDDLLLARRIGVLDEIVWIVAKERAYA